MAVDVSRIPNNNKFDPVREAILQLQTEIEDTGATIGNGTLTISTSSPLTGSGTFTANQTGPTSISIGIDGAEYLTNITHDTVNQKLVVTYGDGTTADLSLAQYIDDTNLARLVSGSLDNQTGIATFTRDDATTFTVDLSALFDDTDTNDFLTSASFDDSNGIITFGVTNQTSVTVDIDGRYPLTSELTAVSDNIITSADFSATSNRFKLTLTQEDAGTIEASFDDVVLSNEMETDYVPYVSVAGGNGATYTTNAVLSQSWLKFNSDTLELGTVSGFSVDSKTIKIGKQVGQNDQWITEYGAREIVSSISSLGGSATAKIEFTTAGRIQFNDEFTFPASDGTSGQVLSTDGSGDLSWVAAGGSLDLDDVTDNGATTTNDISTGRITIANNVSTGGFTSFDDYQLIIYKGGNPAISYGIGIESDTMMFNSDTNYRFYVDNSLKVTINSSGDISSTGNFQADGIISIGTTSTANEFNFAKDHNSGTIMMVENPNNGTSAYTEIIARNIDGTNDIRIGSSANYVSSEWQGGWVFATNDLLLKSNSNVEVFAGGTADSNIVSTFSSSLISLNTNTEITGKITITGSPAIELTGSGTGTYNKTVIYNDLTYGFLLEATKHSDSDSAAKKPITLTWRGGYSNNGGLNLTGDTKLFTDDTGLGVDITSPSAKLHVGGTSIFDGLMTVNDGNNYARLGDLNSNSTMALELKDGTNPVQIEAYGEEMRIYQGASLAIQVAGKTTINPDNEVGKGLRVYYDMDLYNTLRLTNASMTEQGRVAASSGVLYVNGNDEIHFTTSDTNAATFDSSGNLFINGTRRTYFNGTSNYIYSPDGSDLRLGSGDDIYLESSYIRYFGNSTEYARIARVGGSWIDSDLNIGASSADGNYKLKVNGTGYFSDTVDIQESNGVGLIIRTGDISSGSNNKAQLQFGYNGTDTFSHFIRTRHNSSDSGGNSIDFYTCDSTENNSITSGVRHNLTLDSGKVGIGTDSPTSGYKLDVTGSILSQVGSGNTSVVVATSNANGALNALENVGLELATDSTNKRISFRNGTSTNMVITADGDVGIGDETPNFTTSGRRVLEINGSSEALLSFANGGSWSYYIQALASGVYHATGNKNYVIQTGSGGVGINQTSPQAKLHVTGDVALFNVTDDWQQSTYRTTLMRGGQFSNAINNEPNVLKVYPANGATNKAAGYYWGGISFMHLDPEYSSWGSSYTGAQMWIGGRIVDTPGQERSALVFGTNNNTTAGTQPEERMCILPNGTVGIGTTAPPSISSGVPTLSINSPNTNNLSGGVIYQSNGSSQAYHYWESSYLVHQVQGSGGHSFNQGASVLMRVNNGGRLLVNTTTDVGDPFKLQVNGRILQYGSEFLFSGDEDKYITVYSQRSLNLRTSDTTRLTIKAGGDVGINNTNPQAKLHVNHDGSNGGAGDSDYGILAMAGNGQATIGARHTGDGYANLNLGGSSNFWHISKRLSADGYRLEYYWFNGSAFDSKFKFETNGNFTATGDVVAYSDARVKENIVTIDNALDKVKEMRGVYYNRTDQEDDKSKKVGVIAQEIEKVLPEVVTTDNKGMKAVAYGNIVGVLIEAIKEQQKQIDELKARLDA